MRRKPSAPASTASSPAPINPQWRWHYGVLAALRERLLRDRQERLADAAQPLEPHSMNDADSASDELDHNLALAGLSAEQDALHEIDAALARIHRGTYGVCEESGKPIAAARLKAIPWTRFAHTVEARHETEGRIRPPHLGALGSIRGAPTGNLEPISSSEDSEAEERLASDEALRQERAPAAGWATRIPASPRRRARGKGPVL